MATLDLGNRLVLGARAFLVDESTCHAWAEKHVRRDPDLRWITSNYIESDRPNDNGYIFTRSALADAVEHLPGKPFNMLHSQKHIVGTYAGAQVVDGDGTEIDAKLLKADADNEDPLVVEALSSIWHNIFPDEFRDIEKAHNEGSLYSSMECTPESVRCAECGQESQWVGFCDDSYCTHLQASRTAPMWLAQPRFHGGAAIVPPVRPGWKGANSKDLLAVLDGYDDSHLHGIFASIAEDAPHLGPADWESLMAQILHAHG